MNRVIIYPYKIKSKGATRVQEHIVEDNGDCLRVYPDRDYAPKKTDLIIGWGAGNPPLWMGAADRVGARYLNRPEAVCRSVNKIDSFDRMFAAGVRTPMFTTDVRVAKWWQRHKYTIFARQEIEGKDGEGVVVIPPDKGLVDARLYTVGMFGTDEFRVHVFNGKPIYFQKKVPVKDIKDPFIRTTSNGWGFTHLEQKNVPFMVIDESIKAIAAVGLDFGATDVIYSADSVDCNVLEVNTAPELGPMGSKAYADAIRELL